VAQRSRWQAVLLEAGGLSAALSEESMQRLKYWLQVRFIYLILLLLFSYTHSSIYFLLIKKKCTPQRTSTPKSSSSDFVANLQTLPSTTSLSTSRRLPISEEHMRKLRCEKGYRAHHLASSECGVQVCGGRVARAGEGEGKGVYLEVAAAVGE